MRAAARGAAGPCRQSPHGCKTPSNVNAPDADNHTRFDAELESAALRGGVRMYYFWNGRMLPQSMR